MRQCETCVYAMSLGAETACDYMGMTGKRRPSEGTMYSEDGSCKSYEPRTEKKRNPDPMGVY